MAGKRPALLASASAYYRLAAKAERAGNYPQAGQHRDRADRLVREHRRNREYLVRTKGGLRPPAQPATPPAQPKEAAMPQTPRYSFSEQPTAEDGTALCKGGCGLPAATAPRSDPRRGIVKGDPLPYAKGHHVAEVCQAAAKVQPSTQPASTPAPAPTSPQPDAQPPADGKPGAVAGKPHDAWRTGDPSQAVVARPRRVEALETFLERELWPDAAAVAKAEDDVREQARELRADKGWTLAELKRKFGELWRPEWLEGIPAPQLQPQPKATKPRTVSRFRAAQPKSNAEARDQGKGKGKKRTAVTEADVEAAKVAIRNVSGKGKTSRAAASGSKPQRPAAAPSQKQGSGVPGRTLGYRPPLPDDAVRYIRRRFQETGGKDRPAIAAEVTAKFGLPCNHQTVFKIGTRVSRASVPDQPAKQPAKQPKATAKAS